VYELNPGFHRWATDPAGPHILLLPRDAADAFKRNLELLSPDERVRVSLHKVRQGESVASISKKYKTQPIVVRDMNNLGSDSLVVGSEIRVPTAVVNLPAKVMLAAARVDGRGNRSGRRPAVHVVRSGDSLWAIAKRHRMNVNTLARLNGMGPGDTLRAGQKLVLNTRGGGSSSGGRVRVLGRLAGGQLPGAQRRHAVAHRTSLRRDRCPTWSTGTASASTPRCASARSSRSTSPALIPRFPLR
jgi:membrane-bound lytic murein transglycosylase D